MKKLFLPLIALMIVCCSCFNFENDNFDRPEKIHKERIADVNRVPSKNIEQDVCVTPSGNRYHLSSCGTIQGHEIKHLSVAEAQRMGRTPCKKCRPDTKRLNTMHLANSEPVYFADNSVQHGVYTSGYRQLGTSEIESTGYTVYVTPSGKRYHRQSCWHIRGHDVKAMDVSEAQKMGKTPCKDCKP